jgi:ABC-2 type transport system ATP-binding protein
VENKAAIKVEHLKKSYKKVDVLQDVTFEVKPGTIFALLGANGSGKTTTINILTTLIKADGGTAYVSGFEVNKQADKVRHQISLTGQFAAVDNGLSARENLQLICDLRHVTGSNKMVKDLLDKFGLTDAADRRLATFSEGMRRRLDIAMSLIGNPSIIFLDEPTTGFDPEGRLDMWQTIHKLANDGTTVFLTTQYLEEADELADTVAILNHGTIVAQGSANELKKYVPSGLVELIFHNEKDFTSAKKELEKKYTVTKSEDLTLVITTGGKVGELADLFSLLRNLGIEPSEFSQKTPTLDDAFLKIIGSKKEEQYAVS